MNVPPSPLANSPLATKVNFPWAVNTIKQLMTAHGKSTEEIDKLQTITRVIANKSTTRNGRVCFLDAVRVLLYEKYRDVFDAFGQFPEPKGTNNLVEYILRNATLPSSRSLEEIFEEQFLPCRALFLEFGYDIDANGPVEDPDDDGAFM